jgi:glutathione S-transferase
MAEFVDLKQAIDMPGLRVVLISTTPSPWGEAVKGFFHVKKIAYTPVRHPMGKDQSLMRQWTAQESAPVAVYNDERPRSTWPEQLYLAERLNPAPPLIPAAIEDRVRMFGWCNELAGENGLGWSRREIIFSRALGGADDDDKRAAPMRAMARKYNYSDARGQAAAKRVAEILRGLSALITEQKQRGSKFMIGNQLSALDIMWAAFAALIKPLPEELCPLPPGTRGGFTNDDPAIEAATSPLLIEHRDFIYREYLELPLLLETATPR